MALLSVSWSTSSSPPASEFPSCSWASIGWPFRHFAGRPPVSRFSDMARRAVFGHGSTLSFWTWLDAQFSMARRSAFFLGVLTLHAVLWSLLRRPLLACRPRVPRCWARHCVQFGFASSGSSSLLPSWPRLSAAPPSAAPLAALSLLPCLCGAFWPRLRGRALLPRPLGRAAGRAVAAPSRPRPRLVVPRLLWPRLLWPRLWPRFWPRLLGRACSASCLAFAGFALSLAWLRPWSRPLGRAFSAAPFPPAAWLGHSSMLPSSFRRWSLNAGLRVGGILDDGGADAA
jgi:hypothetical protein